MKAGKFTVLWVMLLFLLSSALIGILILSTSLEFTGSSQAVCAEIIESALTSITQQCGNIGTNQLCYAQEFVTVVPRTSLDNSDLQGVGNIQDIITFEEINLGTLDTQPASWGIVLIHLQMSPLQPQNIQVVAFGDVQIRNGFPSMVEANETANQESAYDQPMQAFYLRTNDTASCDGMLPGGLLIQTPTEAESVLFMINGVNIRTGATVFVQARPDQGMMTVTTLEGMTTVEAYGVSQTSPVGTRVRIPLGSNLLAAGGPESYEPYDTTVLQNLPLSILDKQIAIPAAETQATVAERLTSAPTSQPSTPDGSLSSLLTFGRPLALQAVQLILLKADSLTAPLIQDFALRFTPTTPTASPASDSSSLPVSTVNPTLTPILVPTSTTPFNPTPVQPTTRPASQVPQSPTVGVTPTNQPTAAPTNPPAPTAVPTNPPPPSAAPTNPPAPTAAPTAPPSAPTTAPTNPPASDASPPEATEGS